MSVWRVEEWSSESGDGLVRGDALVAGGTLGISREHALVHDFIVGEEVDLVLEEDDAGVIVARDVAPFAWRENAPLAAPPSLPSELATDLARLSGALGPHVRVQLAYAKEDVVRFELHDVDWPPPITPPLATVQFEGVHYIKCLAFSESFVRMTASPWSRFRRERAALLRHWALAEGAVPDDAFVFRFEPNRFRETAGYVIAASIQITMKA